jgi:hypothetical protein
VLHIATVDKFQQVIHQVKSFVHRNYFKVQFEVQTVNEPELGPLLTELDQTGLLHLHSYVSGEREEQHALWSSAGELGSHDVLATFFQVHKKHVLFQFHIN